MGVSRKDGRLKKKQMERIRAMRRPSFRKEAEQAVMDAVRQALVDAQKHRRDETLSHYHTQGSETASASSALDSSSALENPSYDESQERDYVNHFQRGDTRLENHHLKAATRQKPPTNKKRHRKWKRALRPFQGAQAKLLKSLTSEISKEAWMCGVCSKSFTSLLAAQQHEERHIHAVVSDLGWLCNPPEGNMAESSTPQGTPALRADTPLDQKWLNSQAQGKALLHGHSIPDPPPPQEQSLPLRPDVVQIGSTPKADEKGPVPVPIATREQMRAWLANSNSQSDSKDEGASLGSYPPEASPLSPISNQLHNDYIYTNKLSAEHDLLVPHGMKEYLIPADEALEDVCGKAIPLILTQQERDAELELDYLAKDKDYYAMLEERALRRRTGGTYLKFRTEGKTILSKVQNKFVDAYQLIKEGKRKGSAAQTDHYTRKHRGKDAAGPVVLENNSNTLYVNVVVKASLKVVNYELQRMAKARWEASNGMAAEKSLKSQQFQNFRAVAQDNLIKLAGMALAADFTPRRIAIQLSNDFYRLLKPKLKKRGVTIETEIEYRVGPYFVLAVNVINVDWKRLVKTAHRDVATAKLKWKRAQEERDDDKLDATSEKDKNTVMPFLALCFTLAKRMPFISLCYTLTKLTKFEVVAQFLAWCYLLPWFIYTPLCMVLYHSVLGSLFRRYFLATVSDDIFYYVEEKGMEMDVVIRNASTQTSFMLAALREIRAGGRELKKKQGEIDEAGTILGPLLGPAIPEDGQAAPPIPDGFVLPDNLEFVGLELEIPVGFRRLRWAILSQESTFVTEAVFRTESKYEDIEVGQWSKQVDAIGASVLPEGVKEEDIVGAERELQYLMPKSVFVKANTCYETSYIDAYNDYCFVLRKKALTPEVPYGSTFVAWTKYIVINTGADSCKLICSVEAEFPNGPPMISRQIKGGMRAGVGDLFVKTGETINKYADAYP